MKNNTLVLVGFVVLAALVAGQTEEADKEVSLELRYRSLQPGEIVKVSFLRQPGIKQAAVQFAGKKIRMGERELHGEWLAFIGLDLGLKPGAYPIKISILFADGRQHSINKKIMVAPKEFPVKKLWVEEKFVTPPAEALERIQREAELTKAVYAIYTPHWMGNGNFIVPSEGEIVPNFGERRIFNNKPRSPHSGVDISSPLGTPVKASNSGKVVLSNDLYFAGKTIIIDHGLGVFSFYCHFSKTKVPRGALVNKGDIIGEIGATGRVTGPHLHWSVRINGSRIDPFSLLGLKLN